MLRNNQNGYIGLHRKIRQHPLFLKPRKFSEFEAWVDMVMEANFKKEFWEKGNITIHKGQFITSEYKLADLWGWTRKKVRYFLEKLESDKMITKIATQNYTLIEILNYEKYQKKESTPKEYTEDFNKFWEVYPRNTEKKRAFKNWNARIKQGVSESDLILAAKNYSTHCQQEGTDEKFIKHPATFLGASTPYEDWLKNPNPLNPPNKPIVNSLEANYEKAMRGEY